MLLLFLSFPEPLDLSIKVIKIIIESTAFTHTMALACQYDNNSKHYIHVPHNNNRFVFDTKKGKNCTQKLNFICWIIRIP